MSGRQHRLGQRSATFPPPPLFLLFLSLAPSAVPLLGRSSSPLLPLRCCGLARPLPPDPECLLCTSRLIAHFCKLVSISMLHLLPFNIFARPCRKKRGTQQKANPPPARAGKIREPRAEPRQPRQHAGEGAVWAGDVPPRPPHRHSEHLLRLAAQKSDPGNHG